MEITLMPYHTVRNVTNTNTSLAQYNKSNLDYKIEQASTEKYLPDLFFILKNLVLTSKAEAALALGHRKIHYPRVEILLCNSNFPSRILKMRSAEAIVLRTYYLYCMSLRKKCFCFDGTKALG